METLLNLGWFLGATGLLWAASQLVFNGVKKFSAGSKMSSFLTSFIILGVLTSITEISVGVNALIINKPEIFAGNLIGASFVILLFLLPLLAIFNKGINFKKEFDSERLTFFLILLLSPALLTLDGRVSQFDAVLLLMMYGFFVHFFQKMKSVEKTLDSIKLNGKDVALSLVKILGGALMVYLASQVMVDKTIYFAEVFGAPAFVVSIVILSIGTNLPELAITVNSTIRKEPDIALGDFIGSASVNVLLFSIFTLINGGFAIDTNHFAYFFPVIVVGFGLFFLFCRSKNRLSQAEGLILLMVYFVYMLLQSGDILS